MQGWVVGLVEEGTIAATFLSIGFILLVSMIRSRQGWTTNPLLVATFFLFMGCGGSHAIHFLQLLGPSLNVATSAGESARYVYADWHLYVWGAVVAFGGVWYLTLRKRFPALVRGTTIFEDLRERQRRALEVHDNVVQGLARAKLALELERDEEGAESVAETLEAAKKIISDLLEGNEAARTLRPGALRRDTAASEES